MSDIDDLVRAYEDIVHLPWDPTLAGAQKIWFAVYEPAQERRLRFRIPAFEAATKSQGYSWALVDLTDTFAEWMSNHEYRDAYFEQPEDLELALPDYAHFVAARVRETLTASTVNEKTVVAVLGLGSMFGLTFASELIREVAPHVRGRLLGFFPGRYDQSNYRLFDARDGSDYRAVPIIAREWGSK